MVFYAASVITAVTGRKSTPHTSAPFIKIPPSNCVARIDAVLSDLECAVDQAGDAFSPQIIKAVAQGA